MADFKIQIAGHTAAVHSLFESTPLYCKKYWSQEPPEFTITVTQEDLKLEADALLAEALEEGFRVRIFPDPFLERTAIQRKMAEYLFDRNILLLHGSTVAVDGKAYLFTARCGTGKSTHTRLWCQAFGNRTVMVNDDKPFIQITANGIFASGSPWSGKHGLDTNITVPLNGICLLERGKENRIEKANKETLLPMLLAQCYKPLEDAKARQFLDLVERLAETIPLWQMRCTKDIEAAQVAYTAMTNLSK